MFLYFVVAADNAAVVVSIERGGRQTADLLTKVVGNLKRIGFEVDGVASSTVFSDLKEKMERYSEKFESLQSKTCGRVVACVSSI